MARNWLGVGMAVSLKSAAVWLLQAFLAFQLLKFVRKSTPYGDDRLL